MCSDESRACKISSKYATYKSHMERGKPFVEIADNRRAKAADSFDYVRRYSARSSPDIDTIVATNSDPITHVSSHPNLKILKTPENIAGMRTKYIKEGISLAQTDDPEESALLKVDESENHGRFIWLGWFYKSLPSDLTEDGETVLVRAINWAMCGNVNGCS